MYAPLTPLALILRLNTELFLNCVDGVDDAIAVRRVTERTNSIAFLAAHLVETRHYTAGVLEAPLPSPIPQAVARARSLDDAGPLPRMAELVAAWEAVSAHLAVRIERLDATFLAQPGGAFPGSDGTKLGSLAFLVQHESYHVGQLALLRRQLGLPAMAYLLRDREPGRRGA
jgi:uncharacterized damage-inducible protein DinB